MDKKIRQYRARHHRCRNCKYARSDRIYGRTRDWTCNVTGKLYSDVLEQCKFKGMFCSYYEPRED